MAQTPTLANQNSDPPSPEEIRLAAWKYAGYKRFSRFVGFSNEFFIARQFRTLNARVILAMQDEIVELEEELDRLDEALSTKAAPPIHNGSFRLETQRERHRLLWDIQGRLKTFNEYVCSYSQVGNRGEVSKWDVRSVKTFFVKYPNAIQDSEKGYLDTGEDLMYVLPKPASPWLHSMFSVYAYKLFQRRPTDASAFDPEMIFLPQEERRENILTRSILVGLLMLIAPLWILEIVHGSSQRLAVITGFIILFLALVVFATAAKPFERLAATTGYSAVLMVFLQIAPQG